MIRDLSGAKDRTKQTADYLEATVFSKDRAVIMIGNFADVTTEADKKKVKLKVLTKAAAIYQSTPADKSCLTMVQTMVVQICRDLLE